MFIIKITDSPFGYSAMTEKNKDKNKIIYLFKLHDKKY